MNEMLRSRGAVGLAGIVLSFAAAAQTGPKDAEPSTRASNAALLGALPFADREDFEAAGRGFIGSLPGGRVGPDERPVWSIERYAFLQRDAAPAQRPREGHGGALAGSL